MALSMESEVCCVCLEVDEASANNSMRCQVCGRQFKYKSCLITHIETKHPHGQYNLATAKLSKSV